MFSERKFCPQDFVLLRLRPSSHATRLNWHTLSSLFSVASPGCLHVFIWQLTHPQASLRRPTQPPLSLQRARLPTSGNVTLMEARLLSKSRGYRAKILQASSKEGLAGLALRFQVQASFCCNWHTQVFIRSPIKTESNSVHSCLFIVLPL